MKSSEQIKGFLPFLSSMELGQIVRTRRLAMGLTQPQLALAAGCGLRFIVDLEAGKPTVRLENVLRVIAALGASLFVNDAQDNMSGDAHG
jgi:HTH-type transcriptional regulator / antitoxin HipB